MEDPLIYTKTVDMSVLKEGFTIPVRFHELFFERLGFTLSHGESRTITLILEGQTYQATFKNLGFDPQKYSDHGDILQVRYAPASPLAVRLREIFSATQEQVDTFLRNRTDKSRLVIPENRRETLALYATGFPGTLLLDCITLEEQVQAHSELSALDEWRIETAADPDARLVTSVGARKVRHLSRAVGDGLKLLYRNRCQICGASFEVPYGSALIHAHHIEPFVRSLNNDAANILIVCPNHHAVIHDRNPVFDVGRLLYRYPNGFEEGLKINLHLDRH